jgi:hypothetical protein
MARFARKTFNDVFLGEHPLSPQQERGGVHQFLANRASAFLSPNPFNLERLAVTTMGPVAGMAYLGMTAMAAPMEMVYQGQRALRFLEKVGRGGPEFAGPWVDTRMAYTMRQAALQAMHDSAYSLRGAIGNEARLLHS